MDIFWKKKQKVIYNPWSIIMYINKASLRAILINTSGNAHKEACDRRTVIYS